MTIEGAAINQLSEQIIGGAFKVANALGTGFLEKVYENALAHELRKAGLQVRQQVGVAVHYDGVVVGEYSADLLVEDTGRFLGRAVLRSSGMYIRHRCTQMNTDELRG